MNTQAEMEEWLADRPQAIKDSARIAPPWNQYKIRSTGQTCVIVAYAENGTVRVDITSPTCENLFGVQRQVFGIDVLDLVPITDLDKQE